MKYLLDTSALIACLWDQHEFYERAASWAKGKKLITCPISEMGFLRIGTHPKGLGLSMSDARDLLKDFTSRANVGFVSADLPCLDSKADSSPQVTDIYLAELASRHGMKLATFDSRIKHAAVEGI